jgi:hypothetical protein
MKSLKVGAILLSVWSGLNLLLAVAILTGMTVFGRDPPSLGLVFTADEIERLDGKALALIDALAIFGNACAAAFCLLVLVVVWRALVGARARWALPVLALSMGGLQAFGFVSDASLGHRDLAANLVSTALLTAGLACSGWALRRAAAAAPDTAR